MIDNNEDHVHPENVVEPGVLELNVGIDPETGLPVTASGGIPHTDLGSDEEILPESTGTAQELTPELQYYDDPAHATLDSLARIERLGEKLSHPHDGSLTGQEYFNLVRKRAIEGHFTLDSIPEHADEEGVVVPARNDIQVIVDQEAGTVTAKWDGKALIERNPQDWFYPTRFYIDRAALGRAWLTKFKTPLPPDVNTSFSFNGGFSMSGITSPFTVTKRPSKVSKHAGGQKKKKRRK